MQLVIEIPEVKYNMIREKRYCGIYDAEVYEAIANGTPLPKGHGRLIDADNLEECKEIMTTIYHEIKYAVRMDDIRNTTTIIEDTESEV